MAYMIQAPMARLTRILRRQQRRHRRPRRRRLHRPAQPTLTPRPRCLTILWVFFSLGRH